MIDKKKFPGSKNLQKLIAELDLHNINEMPEQKIDRRFKYGGYGHPQTLETRAKISASRQKKRPVYKYGHSQSSETRDKISKTVLKIKNGIPDEVLIQMVKDGYTIKKMHQITGMRTNSIYMRLLRLKARGVILDQANCESEASMPETEGRK